MPKQTSREIISELSEYLQLQPERKSNSVSKQSIESLSPLTLSTQTTRESSNTSELLIPAQTEPNTATPSCSFWPEQTSIDPTTTISVPAIPAWSLFPELKKRCRGCWKFVKNQHHLQKDCLKRKRDDEQRLLDQHYKDQPISPPSHQETALNVSIPRKSTVVRLPPKKVRILPSSKLWYGSSGQGTTTPYSNNSQNYSSTVWNTQSGPSFASQHSSKGSFRTNSTLLEEYPHPYQNQ